MSKAFTKETDTNLDENEGLSDEALTAGLPQGARNYLTPPGAKALQDELHRLLHEDRPALVKTIEWAASNGDRSENADYIYGKRRLREMDRRIRFLTKRLEIAQVIDPQTQSTDRVVFGLEVVIQDESGEQKTFQIVGIDETDVPNGRISWISPLAKAVLNTKVGDVVLFRSPKSLQAGDEGEELEVLEIRRPLG